MTSPPILLVPGFWLGAWAWDDVAARLRTDGLDVTAITLPGLESRDADRSRITLSDHVDAICDAIVAAGRPVVLVVHSATGFSGYAAADRVPERIAAMVYVDTAPGKGAIEPSLEGDKPMVWANIEAEENLDGLTEAQKQTFRDLAVPVPGGVLRETIELKNDARNDIPATLIATGFSSADYRKYAAEHPSGPSWPVCPSFGTSNTSTCRRATGRCGRSQPSWHGSCRCRPGPRHLGLGTHQPPCNAADATITKRPRRPRPTASRGAPVARPRSTPPG